MRDLTQNEISNDFVRIPRAFQALCVAGEMTFDEKCVLEWLWESANPVNGKVRISYRGLCDELGQKYSTNRINKILLSLKVKGLVFFEKQQGKRSAFEVRIKYYPLSSGKFVRTFDNVGDVDDKNDRSQAELKTIVQKSSWSDLSQDSAQMTPIGSVLGRTSNNDSEKNTDTNKIDSNSHIIETGSFVPGNREEERCLDFARDLGEKDMRFILSILRKHGLSLVERAMGLVCEANPDSLPIKKRGAYFNIVVQDLISKIR